LRDVSWDDTTGLLGCSISDRGVPWTILPFMTHGDLRSFIADARKVDFVPVKLEN